MNESEGAIKVYAKVYSTLSKVLVIGACAGGKFGKINFRVILLHENPTKEM